ncbi:hypothetical protein B0J17DRAFT_115483 [Rhizoctonia solani]|nr:hypothetical protein B0J17DRAFT_115483 [Rhizoctonia solani]
MSPCRHRTSIPKRSRRTFRIRPFHITSESLSPELQPVLLWSQTGLDDRLRHTLRLALAPLHSEDNAEMTIAKVTYTKTLGKPRPDTPKPPPDQSYEGPLFPPHAKKWVPRPPPPPPPKPEPSTSQPESTQPSTTNPPKSTRPADPPPHPTHAPPNPRPTPIPEPGPEPEPPTPPAWLLCLLGFGLMAAVMKRRADRKRRELEALLNYRVIRVDVDSYQYHWVPHQGYGGSTIYGGSSRYGGTGYGGGNNYGPGTNYEGSSTHGSTIIPGNDTQNYGPPPTYTRPPTYHAGRSALSGASTNLPPYSDVAHEQRELSSEDSRKSGGGRE